MTLWYEQKKEDLPYTYFIELHKTTIHSAVEQMLNKEITKNYCVTELVCGENDQFIIKLTKNLG